MFVLVGVPAPTTVTGLRADYGISGHFENNLFDSNDWTCHDDDDHSGMGCVLLGAAGGHSDVFTRNTMVGNGPSVMYRLDSQPSALAISSNVIVHHQNSVDLTASD